MSRTDSVWLAACFAAGAGIMMLELSAPRLMQPWFGASTFVWTNVIGVLLFALSVGYFIGGRLSNKGGAASRVGLTLTACGVWTALIPLALPTVARLLLPEPTTLVGAREARTILEVGSLVVTLLLVAPPVFVLGTVSPQIVAVLARDRDVGVAAGRVFMLGTLGSLLGTFLPTYFLIPLLGTRGTALAAAAFLILAGASLLLGRRRLVAVGSGVLVLVTSAAFLHGRPVRGAEPDETVLKEVESDYQYLRVSRVAALGDVEEGATERLLRINEGLAEFHSVAVDEESTTAGKYYDYFALLPSCFPSERRLRVLVLGSGAGTMARVLRDVWGRDRFEQIINVELDPAVVELEADFGADDLVTLVGDGRAVARTLKGPFDLVFVDAYARQIDIPFHMASVEFFELVRDRLSKDGILALNVSGSDRDEPLMKSLVATLSQAAFARIATTPVVYWGNIMVWAGRDDRRRGFDDVPEELGRVERRALRFTTDAVVDESAIVLTDDHAPLEWLTDQWLRGER